MLKRVITGAVFTAIILGGIYLRGWALRALMLAAMLIGMFEVYRAIKKPERSLRNGRGMSMPCLRLRSKRLCSFQTPPNG